MLTADPAGAVVELTRQLVALDSVNPGLVPGAAGEGPIAEFVAGRLSGSGFEVRLVPAPSDPRRMSVIAVRDGGRPGRTVVLNGHLDTVGVDGMAEPFTARIDGDRMSGRGTSDMKGGVAGLVIAAEQLVAAGAPGRLVVALVADEEDASLGAAAVLEALGGDSGVRADVCLIAEPTWLDLAVAHRGYAVVKVGLRGRVRARGRAHGPARGRPARGGGRAARPHRCAVLDGIGVVAGERRPRGGLRPGRWWAARH